MVTMELELVQQLLEQELVEESEVGKCLAPSQLEIGLVVLRLLYLDLGFAA